MTTAAESFESLLNESIEKQEGRIGDVVEADVINIDQNYVTVSAGLKSESFIALEEFRLDDGTLEVQVGDRIQVVIEQLEDGYGTTRLSREKARRLAVWAELEKAMEEARVINGIVNGKVKGGLTVLINNSIRAFLPGSLVDVRPVKDTTPYENKAIEVKVIKIDRKRNNVVVSRRAVLETTQTNQNTLALDTIVEGMKVSGIVKNITDYGAFIDLGGIDGLLHITDLAWRRVKHPSEVLTLGDEIEAVVLKYDQDKHRVSLGLKQLQEDPWVGLASRYPQHTRLHGKVTNLTDYGSFVEIEQGIEGLVHVSEMDWTNKNVHPSKVVSVGDEVEVMILEIDEERRRISLGMKQCKANPWEEFASQYKKGDKVSGQVKSVTDFGLFIGLNGNIDGLVHLSDLSWKSAGDEVVRNYKKGDEVEAVVLGIDVDRERVSLGIKQLENDPFNDFADTHEKETTIKGVIRSIDAKGAVVVLGEGVEGYLRTNDMPRDANFAEGDEVETTIFAIDRKSRNVGLTMRPRNQNNDENGGGREYRGDRGDREQRGERRGGGNKSQQNDNNQGAGTTSLGDLLREKLAEQNNQ